MESYLLFEGAQYKHYLGLLHEAYRSLNLNIKGCHVLRHTLCTEWERLRISPRLYEIVLGHKKEAHEDYVHLVGQINSETERMMMSAKIFHIEEAKAG